MSTVTHWHYDASRTKLTHRASARLEAERWRYDEHGWLTGCTSAKRAACGGVLRR
ncbi:hypothetical protein KCP73_01510 [Salmonella enterica subsp. enterica]|nr:hypothetical protein KCP73_01510 [Salmonella enterica subsp. enterica]